jgi:hypothetical protein
MFSFHLFHESNYASRCFISVPAFDTNLPLQLALSRWMNCCLCYIAANSFAFNFKTGRGSPAHAGSLPLWAPDGPRHMPCGQGLPPVRPDGAVAEGPVEGGLCDEDDEDDDGDVEEDSLSSYSDRWVSGSGTSGCFRLACWGPSGLWRPWFPLKGDLGRPLFLPQPIPDPGSFQFRRFWASPQTFVGFSPRGEFPCQRPVGPHVPTGGSRRAGGLRRGR